MISANSAIQALAGVLAERARVDRVALGLEGADHLERIQAHRAVGAAVIEEAARRARKYGGALGTATQSADDFYGSAQMEAAFNCSDWVFLLRQKPESLAALEASQRLPMNETSETISMDGKFVVKKPGTYKIVCTLHTYMTGTLKAT